MSHHRLLPSSAPLPFLLLASVLLSTIFSSTAFADSSAQEESAEVTQPAFTYTYNSQVISLKQKPKITLQAVMPIKKGSIVITRDDGKQITKNFGRMSRGQKKTISLDQPAGVSHYKMEISATISKTKRVRSQIEFDINYGTPLKVDASPSNLDLPNRTLSFGLSRPADKVIVTFLKKNGQPINTYTTDISNQGTNITITWPPVPDEVDAISIKVIDPNGIASEAKIDPFWIEIPHQEVTFDTGLASWQPSEEPKLFETLKDLKKLVDHHKKEKGAFQLYIAGYTDSVGASDFNQILSQNRADAIARWFLSKGIDIPIYTQGFGEDAPAKQTPDNTPEPANRRALYLLGTTRPEISKNFPRAAWKRVN